MPADRLQIPILKTHRLSMEPISFSYSQEMFELWSDAEVCKFSGAVKDSLENCSEIAFHLLPKHWGKGIMTEASQAAIEWRRSNRP